MDGYFRADNLSVGYDGKTLIRDIAFGMEKGSILTLIGPNGAGKSTILKTITRHLAAISGAVLVDGQSMFHWPPKETARQVAVVLTDRVRPELMTAAEVVAMGRYPYTNMLGKLTAADLAAVEGALRRVHATELADQDFTTLSDGQRQRVLLARAICQEPNILVLDEPTAYLDIRYKIELLDILREMAKEKKITVIMSLHEIDLAMKASDYLMCVKGETIAAFGRPEDILNTYPMERLYEMENGSYNPLLGSMELVRPQGDPEWFVVAGNGCGIPHYRQFQKQKIPFATGILFENDVDYQVARALSGHVICAPAFQRLEEKQFAAAAETLLKCKAVLDAGTPIGEWNEMNRRLLDLAEENGMRVWTEFPGKEGAL